MSIQLHGHVDVGCDVHDTEIHTYFCSQNAHAIKRTPFLFLIFFFWGGGGGGGLLDLLLWLMNACLPGTSQLQLPYALKARRQTFWCTNKNYFVRVVMVRLVVFNFSEFFLLNLFQTWSFLQVLSFHHVKTIMLLFASLQEIYKMRNTYEWDFWTSTQPNSSFVSVLFSKLTEIGTCGFFCIDGGPWRVKSWSWEISTLPCLRTGPMNILKPAAPTRLADRKHCALSTHPNPPGSSPDFSRGFSRHGAPRPLSWTLFQCTLLLYPGQPSYCQYSESFTKANFCTSDFSSLQ